MKLCFKPLLASLALCFGFPFTGVCERFSYTEASIEELSSKVEEGNAEAQYRLGYLCLNGSVGIRIDLPRAVKLLRVSAEQGNPDAQAVWGHMLVTAHGVPVDSEAGLAWIKKSAKQQNAEAQFFMGTYYETGRAGLKSDRFEAMDWYIKAAQKGHLQAGINLDRMREESDAIRTCHVDSKWWEIPEHDLIVSAKQGNSDAQWQLGMRYEGHGGTEVDIKNAKFWFGRAIMQTNMAAYHSMALHHISSGEILPERAFKYCMVAAARGDIDAMCTLARFYRDGVGIEADRGNALSWYRQAMAARHPLAEGEIRKLIQGEACFEHSSVHNTVEASKYSQCPVLLSIRDLNNEKRTVNLIGYDQESDLVEMDYQYGSTRKLPLIAFSKESLDIIKNEAVFRAFEGLSLMMRQVKLSKKEIEQEGRIEGKIGVAEYEYDGFIYHLEVRNPGVVRISDLKVTGKFLYTNKKQSSGGSRYADRGQQSYSLSGVTVGAGEVNKFETEPFILESYNIHSSYYFKDGRPTMVEARPVGLFVRVSCEMKDGAKVYRDFYEKPSLESKVNW